MTDDPRFAELMAQADEHVRQLDALETQFIALGDVEIGVSFDDLRNEIAAAPACNHAWLGALRA